jgi:phosphoribosyl 1,2-cyclic phosphodiesterase
MTGRFTVLASGSSGNAALLETEGFGLLIDCGLQPRMLTGRLQEIQSGWDKIHAVILTHTHGDHWKDHTLAEFRSRKIPLYAHAAQLEELATCSELYEPLRHAKLLRSYSHTSQLELTAGLKLRPIRVSHDADPTFAFRIDCLDRAGLAWSIGYASDLGCGSAELIEAFAGVDVLALEYNHELELERRSRRPQFLIDRVLSNRGHLSNCQAAELTTAIAARSGVGYPGHLVQLHLSKECNRPELASVAGRASLAAFNPLAEVITARQDRAARPIALLRKPTSANRCAVRATATTAAKPFRSVQPSLPGFDA